MSYLLFIACGYLLILLAAKMGTSVDDTTWLCLAILTAAEVISSKRQKLEALFKRKARRKMKQELKEEVTKDGI